MSMLSHSFIEMGNYSLVLKASAHYMPFDPTTSQLVMWCMRDVTKRASSPVMWLEKKKKVFIQISQNIDGFRNSDKTIHKACRIHKTIFK